MATRLWTGNKACLIDFRPHVINTMTPTFNLLPWRDQRRQRLRQHFFSVLAIVIITTCLVIMLNHYRLQQTLDRQQQRNDYLQQYLSTLEPMADATMVEHYHTRLAQQQTLDTLIQQQHHPTILLNELLIALPEGIFYTQLQQQDAMLILHGKAESHQRIADLIRHLSTSTWFHDIQLNVTTTAHQPQEPLSFQATLTIDAHQH